MKLHKFEKIWLYIAALMLVLTVVYSAFQLYAYADGPPSGRETIDPEKVTETAPFDAPGVFEKENGEYEVVMILRAFSFEPNKVEVPAGAKVMFKMTSADVIHGFQILDTNVNAMVTPGHVQEFTTTFKKPGEYLVVCNEYCGVGHQHMSMRIHVK